MGGLALLLGPRFGAAGVNLGVFFRPRLGGSYDELPLLEPYFFECCTFGLDDQTFGTSDTDSKGLSRGSSDESCPWLKHLPPWRGF